MRKDMLRKTLIILIFFYLIPCPLTLDPAFAQGEAGGAAPFLYFGVGSRPLAMGGAYIAVSDDATSAYWNPAGMIQLRQNELQTMHTEIWAEVKYDYVGYVHILGSRGKGQGASKENPVSRIKYPASKALGLSFIRLDAGTQEARDSFKDITGYFSCNDTAVILSYAQRLGARDKGQGARDKGQEARLSGGVNLKYVRQKIGEESGKGYDMDIGFLYKPLLGARDKGQGTRDKGQGARKNEPLALALVFQNILQSKIDWSTGAKDPLPFIFKVGTAYRLTNDKLILALDTAKIQHEPTWKFHLGGEYKVIGTRDKGQGARDKGQGTSKEQNPAKDKTSVSIRVGSDDKNFTAGIGVAYENYSFDYAYVTHERLGNKHRISVGMRF